MGDIRFMQPPFAWGECAYFKVPYTVYCTTAVGDADSSVPTTKEAKYRNGQKVLVQFFVSGDAVFIQIPEIHLQTGFNGATYHSEYAAGGSYVCESNPRITLIPYTYDMLETDRRIFYSKCTPTTMAGRPTYVRYAFSGYGHVLPECEGFDGCARVLYGSFGKTYRIPVDITIASGGIINIYAVNGAFHAMKGSQSDYNGEFFGIDATTFMYNAGGSVIISGDGFTENDIDVVKDTNMSYKTFINKLYVNATKYDEIPITESNYATRLPFPDPQYYPTDDNLYLSPTHEYMKDRSYNTLVKPDKPSASGNGADPNEDNSKMTTEE